MNFTPVHGPVRVGLIISFAALAGCATVHDNPDGPKIVVDGDQYVTMDAPVGSHMKRRVKVVDIKQPGISPTRTDIVTAETDTNVLPPTAGEMERAISAPGGR